MSTFFHPSPTTANNRQPPQTQPQTHFFSYDSNGNVMLLTDPACVPSASYRCDSFGRVTKAAGPAAALNRYQFSTKPIEVGSGFAYYGYRYYSPELGRWISRDPLGEKGGENLQRFVNNNSLIRIDKYGLLPICDYYSSSNYASGSGAGWNWKIQYNPDPLSTDATVREGDSCCMLWMESWRDLGFTSYWDCACHLYDDSELPELLDNSGDVSGSAGAIVAGAGYTSAGAAIGLLGGATGAYATGNLLAGMLDCDGMKCVIDGKWTRTSYQAQLSSRDESGSLVYETCTLQCLACLPQ
jgi:RHS repeat-associated protein